jgi:hypothetical protein
VRGAQLPEPSGMSFTGELVDTEKVTVSSEGRRWKSACKSNSLASYPTSRSVPRGLGGSNPTWLLGSSGGDITRLSDPYLLKPFEQFIILGA